VEKQHFYPENDVAKFEKEVFLHVGLDLTIKNLILNYNLKNSKNRFFF
jgi:hypothetical protein